ncbi:hypothetical protein B0H19DRAFT_1113039 [Mycena capillaripes]|nr:hypothetical protein B0H19DRAFT_1113039 [Mycena capillaripes]
MNLRAPLWRLQTYYGQRFQSTSSHGDEFEAFTRRLNWLLRHGAMPPTIRPDGFVRLNDVRNFWLFRRLLPSEFDALLERDNSKRFKIIQDYDLRVGTDSPWIRARTGHTIPAVNLTVKRILSPDESAAVYQAVDLNAWMHAKRYGIHPLPSDGLIHLLPIPSTENFSHAAGNVCILFDIAKMLSAGIQLFRTTRGEVLTTGDADGVLPPRMFVEAVNIEVERESLPLPDAEDCTETSRIFRPDNRNNF